MVAFDLDTGGPKKRHVFVRLREGDTSPFLINPDAKEEKMYCCMVVLKPFATAKYKGVTEAWASAVADVNNQLDMKTGKRLFNPPISVKAVRDRFDAVMKIVKDLQAGVPFRSGNDDEEEPSTFMQIIEDLYEMKTSFETVQTGVKDGTAAKKKKDRDAAKAIQLASLGKWVAGKASSSSSDSESDATVPKKKSKTDSGEKPSKTDSEEKKPRVSMSDTLASFSGAVEARVADQAAKQAAKQELKQRKFVVQAELKKEAMLLKKEEIEIKKRQTDIQERLAAAQLEEQARQAAAQLELQARQERAAAAQLDVQARQAAAQLEMNAQMIALMKSMQNNRGDN
jgi:hypothetical protein